MNVCDHCLKKKVEGKVMLKGKSYDLCSSCIERIRKFLETPEESFGNKLGELFK